MKLMNSSQSFRNPLELDLDNIDVDFIEDMMLKSKPLQGILNDIRGRQIRKLEDVKKTYGDAIKDLEALVVERPAKGAADELIEVKKEVSEGEALEPEKVAEKSEPAPEEAPAPTEA